MDFLYILYLQFGNIPLYMKLWKHPSAATILQKKCYHTYSVSVQLLFGSHTLK